jgi:Domain of unknown function (DUF4129)
LHSRAEAGGARPPPAAARAAALVLATTALIAPIGAAAAPTPAPTIRPSTASMTATPRAALEVAAVEAAASAVRADPDLGSVRRQRTWRLRDQARPDDPPTTLDPFWISLARWLAEGGRGLVWLLGAVALAIVLVAARRWLAVHGESVDARGARLPSHVRELDIRPESLPADIGAAVRKLWLAGERRAALSLLYRGALSRLVHSYAVAIGAASTEGDCVRLARAALPRERSDFVAALVQAWQLAVYGDRPLATDAVLHLCEDFDRLLPAAVAPPEGRPA